MSIYCYSYSAQTGLSMRTAPPGYVAATGEFLSSPEPASDAALEAWFPSYSGIKTALLPYASQKRAFVEGGGTAGFVTWNIASAGSAPINIDVDLSTSGQMKLVGAVSLSWLNPSQIFQWSNNDGTVVNLTAAQVQTLGQLVGAFVQNTFVTYAALVAAINAAPPTVTTFAQIDAPAAPLPAWPTN